MKILFSAYRLDQYPEPDGFMAQAAIVLGAYAEEVVAYVTHPMTGIQATCKFPPTVAEIKAACEAKSEAIARQKSIEEWRERKAKSDMLKAAGVRKPELGGMTYPEFLERCKAQGVPARAVGRFESVPKAEGVNVQAD